MSIDFPHKHYKTLKRKKKIPYFETFKPELSINKCPPIKPNNLYSLFWELLIPFLVKNVILINILYHNTIISTFSILR